MKTMRLALAAAIALAASFGAAPAHAQGGNSFMWCLAWADNGADKTYYYSGFFSAAAWEAEGKARAFKAEVEDAEISAATVSATCMAPAEYDKAIATRNAAMKAGPGTVLSWEG
jgi:hypothetical protein